MHLKSILVEALLLAAPVLLHASQIFTATGNTTGGPVDAEVTFSLLGTNQLQVTIQDLLPNPTDTFQLISDVQFQIAGVTEASLSGSSAQQITVNTGGTGVLGATASTGWAFGPFNGGLILCVVCPAGIISAATPAQTIIGPGLGGGSSMNYAAANGSIAGNAAHNPFLDQTAMFTISGTGITSSSCWAEPAWRLRFCCGNFARVAWATLRAEAPPQRRFNCGAAARVLVDVGLTLIPVLAAALAIAEFQHCGFADAAPGPASRLTVTVEPPTTTHELTFAKLSAWLGGGDKTPGEQATKVRLRELLG